MGEYYLIGLLSGVALCLIFDMFRKRQPSEKKLVRIVHDGLGWDIEDVGGTILHSDFFTYEDAEQFAIIKNYQIIN